MSVIADLRVTDSNDIRRGYPFAALKNVILSETVLVASAGNAELAMHTLRTVPPRPTSADEVLPRLAESSGEAGSGDGRVDFLVAVAREGLWRVKCGDIEQAGRATWIGDQRAFDVYQQAYHTEPVAPVLVIPGLSPEGPLPVSDQELDQSLRMSNGIHRLELDGSIDSVGEAFIDATATRSRGFRYQPQAFLAADHEQTVSGDKWVAADWGTVAEGGFGYSTLVPVEAGIGALGLYFPHAGLGLLYHPLNRDDAFVYPRSTHAEFRARVLAEHNLALDGPSFSC